MVKQRMVLLVVVLAGAAFASEPGKNAMVAAMPGEHTAPEAFKAGAVPAAEAAAQAFQDALKQGDRGKALALLAPEAQISEGGETQNAAEYAAHHLGEDIAFLKDAKVAVLSRTSMQKDATAQVASDSRIETTSGGKPLTLHSQERMELRRIDNTWKIVAIAWTSERIAE